MMDKDKDDVVFNGITLYEYLEQFVATYKSEPLVAKNTQETYIYTLASVKSFIDNKLLQDFSRSDAQDIVNAAAKYGYSLAKIVKIKTLLSQACEQADEDKLISSNPVYKIFMPKIKPKRSGH